MTDFIYEKDADGIVIVTIDMQGQSANTMNEGYVPGMDEVLAKLRAEPDLTGVVFASAKKTFFAGGDLRLILAIEKSDAETLHYIEENKRPFRELEKLPVPVVAAINGAALGGGYELCLACNHRIIADVKGAVVGLPEVTLGLLPGAGGVVRLTKLLGLEQALPHLTEGKPVKPQAALKIGMVDAVVDSVDALVPAAKAWIKANPDAHAQPWDQKGFRYPGGDALHPKVRQLIMAAPAVLYQKTRGLLPAPAKILDIAVNSMRMDYDAALLVESRGICALAVTPECKASITTFFFGMQAIKGGKVRPEGDHWRAKSAAILGAGMMGSGIAWAHANAGLPSVLKDMEMDKAEKGKSNTATLADKRIKRGRMDAAKKDQLLSMIVPATEDSAFEGTDLIVEAVFEDIALKEKVIPASFAMLGEDGIYGSNTSTLPISILAEACPDPSRFIGLHFFSPVDKMKVVEIILGEKTSEDTLRKAYDYVQQIGYMPIVVNDSRGFFTSRVFGTYLDEGISLMVDGMNPVAVERAGWMAGMPVGPLAVHDEVSLVLSQKVANTHKALDDRLGVDSGFGKHNTASKAVCDAMIAQDRGGRHYGGGFYDYAADGSKSLWSGLDQFAQGNAKIDIQDAIDRLLYRQAIETLRCLNEGVLRTEVEANLGGIFAIGFPAHTGGAIQFIRGIGIDRFAARAAELADAYGERFALAASDFDILREKVVVAA
ncbi:Fatty acid oxidation complex subunit alpha [Thalassovita gelatinovora]|uniref:Fatty acid oxidation complex subunit alpha n=1 Tax=Thalassovita gelatinovora TaxID=53501 RepID=A0A0N7LVY2_THAGE|nr:3-hydroxyacyl-CoA dehydrogenase NAD-binding domain-containing protein [Thalassovita gelatinovora]QIZ82062.1 3-hydroxyacyl-CoA dehydrogenase [Thalassovita gelatinovora]CUH67570.1 Fatty acid oxidation complex subunit alpha [Thalassovita gelatinovora]SEP71547.1 3-hydroxyacyl-CoA dehydrogenase / enoyl-CoA hydratase / 3-hydroxybutyryl-CoA epimerase [Thalassovita gelatinovora]